jgi:hypothetical protein
MKKLFTLTAVICLFVYTGRAQSSKPAPVSITFNETLGGSGDDEVFSFCEFDTSEVLVAGYSNSNNGIIPGNFGNYDYLAMKFTHSSTPQLQWIRNFGGSKFEKGRQIAPTYDHKAYVEFGTTHSANDEIDKSQLGTSKNMDNWWLIKFDSTGTILKQKVILGDSNAANGGRVVLPTSDNGFLLLGWSQSHSGIYAGSYGALDGWLIKLDSNMNIEWTHNYGGSGTDGPIRITRAGDFYYFTGLTTSNNHDFQGEAHKDSTGKNSQDIGVWKTDTLGNVIWAKSIGGSNFEEPYDIQADWDGNVIAGGFAQSKDGDISVAYGNQDVFFFKLSADSGKLMWAKSFGGTKADAVKRILPMPDHGYVLLCTAASLNHDAKNAGNHGSKDVWLIRTDSNRNIIWSKMFGGSGLDEGIDMLFYPKQGYLIAARTASSDGDLQGINRPVNSKDFNYWIFFVTDSTLLDTSGTTTLKAPVSSLSQDNSVRIFPSVTSGTLTIQSANSTANGFSVKIMNTAGQTIWNQSFSNSFVNRQIDLSDKAKGLYFVEVQFANGTISTQKIILQ